MTEIIETLKKSKAIRDSDGITIKKLTNIEPEYDNNDLISTFPNYLQDSLREKGITRLYKHQAEAISLAILGNDVVLESPTASGKTLCFFIPLILKLVNNRDSHGLIIHPMKALSNDQRRQLNELVDRITGRRIESWIYDGDTTEEHRRLIRQNPPAILFTNPEMLHLTFLGHSDKWDEFLRNLSFIVIDEIHEYRGYFGTNFSFLMRRFLKKLSVLKVTPQLFLATATCANSLEHAERLTRRNFKLVQVRDNFRPHRIFIFIIPDIPDYKYYDKFKQRIVLSSLSCLSKDLSTIVFCNSRKLVEELLKKAKRDVNTVGLDSEKIKAYRAGFTPDERREIEDGMREGRYKIIFTTNALEIGIDIGRLDVCILAGFPDNAMSAWQRIGRTGRNWDKSAFTIFYALNNAYDQFFAGNIEAFLQKPLDEILIGLDNEEIMEKHIPYLLYESNWILNPVDKEILGETFYQKAIEVTNHNKPVITRGPNYQSLGLRGISSTNYILKLNNNNIGEISDNYRFREAYIGAIYNHLGKPYRVAQYGVNEIILKEYQDIHHKTEPIIYIIIQSSDIIEGFRYNNSIAIYYGKLSIVENFNGYRLIDERNGNIIEDVSRNEARWKTVHSFWLSIDDSSSFTTIDINNIKTFEQFLRLGTTFIIPCDRHDINTYSKITDPPSIFVYELIPGGIGIAEKILKVWENILDYGINIAKNCNCLDGCPKCIYPPLHRNSSRELSKKGGLLVADIILDMTTNSPDEKYDIHTHSWSKL